MTRREIWLNALRCIPGVAEKDARAVARHYPYAALLLRAYARAGPAAADLLAPIVKDGVDRRLGGAVSRRVWRACAR